MVKFDALALLRFSNGEIRIQPMLVISHTQAPPTMNTPNALLRNIGFGFHGLAAIALVLLYLKTGMMTLVCIVPGVLIGIVSVVAKRGRPSTLYAGFGLLMGYAFWSGVSLINQGYFLDLVPIVLLAIGAVWFLETPNWPAALYTGIMILLCLGSVALIYKNRHDLIEFDLEHIRNSVITSVVVLIIGLIYGGLGFVESAMDQPRKRKRRPRKAVQPQEETDQ